jgi:HlyD family secretion protein
MKRIIPILLLAAAAGAAFYFYPQWFHPPAAESEMKLSGNIEAHESMVSFKVSGRIVDLPVEEGQALKAGQLIARLDNDDYRQQVAMDEAALHVRNRQLELALAGSREQDIQAARQSVEDARADLEQKQKDFERYDALYRKDEISAQTRDLAQTNDPGQGHAGTPSAGLQRAPGGHTQGRNRRRPRQRPPGQPEPGHVPHPPFLYDARRPV